MAGKTRPTVFISYSWDNDAHRSWVNSLAARLDADGIHVVLDKRELAPGDHLPTFMSEAIRNSDFVLIICTPAYRNRVCRREGGVFYESAVIASERLLGRDDRTIIPVLREGEPASAVPDWCRGYLWVDLRGDAYEESEYMLLVNSLLRKVNGERVISDSAGDLRLQIEAVNWGKFIDVIAQDRYDEGDGGHACHGWSRSYANRAMTYAEKINTEGLSVKDSVTETSWMIRGLVSLRRLISRRPDARDWSHRIQCILSEAEGFLDHHWEGEIGASGIFREGFGRAKIFPDVRHTLTWIKGKLELGAADVRLIHSGVRFASNHIDISDRRLYTFVELGFLVRLLETRPALRPPELTESRLRDLRSRVEAELLKPERRMISAKTGEPLFVEPGEEQLAHFLTWWVLDACGEFILASGEGEVRRIVSENLQTLAGLSVPSPMGAIGFPLKLGDPVAEAGTTAHIAEVMLRFLPHMYAGMARQCTAFVLESLLNESAFVYPYMAWAIPCLFETVESELAAADGGTGSERK